MSFNFYCVKVSPPPQLGKAALYHPQYTSIVLGSPSVKSFYSKGYILTYALSDHPIDELHPEPYMGLVGKLVSGLKVGDLVNVGRTVKKVQSITRSGKRLYVDP